MKKKTNIRQVIRKMVREEVALAISEVITELKQPTQQVSQPQPKKKIVEKKTFTKNSIINDVLNETESEGEWKSVGKKSHTTEEISNIVGGDYGEMMSTKPSADQMVISSGGNPDSVPNKTKSALTRDYSGIVEAMAKSSRKKRGG